VAAPRARAARAGPRRGRRRRRRGCVRGAARPACVSGGPLRLLPARLWVEGAACRLLCGGRHLSAAACRGSRRQDGPACIGQRDADVLVARTAPCMPPASAQLMKACLRHCLIPCARVPCGAEADGHGRRLGTLCSMVFDRGPGRRARMRARMTARRRTPTGASPAASAGGATTTSISERRTHQTRAARAGATAEVLARVHHMACL